MMRGQSAVEYLSVYAVAFIIVLVVLAAVYYVWNANQTVTPHCELTVDLYCTDFYIRQNGSLVLMMRQTTGHPIRVTGFNCTAQSNDAMVTKAMDVYMNDGELKTVVSEEPCYRVGGEIATGSAGSFYSGRIYIKYTEADTGFSHSIVGKIVARYE
ncbi:MAG: hypothetical protein QXF56_02055 [Candidatus Micrarchaeia archaeon]